MPKFIFDKLVRDKIPDLQRDSGAIPSLRVLTPKEHKEQLINKIIEEAREILPAARDELASEMADVQQALDDLRDLMGVSAEELARAQALKNDKKGSFKKGIFIDHVERDENDEWVEYYRRNPDRFPEIK